MRGLAMRSWGESGLSVLVLLLPLQADGKALDQKGEIKFGVRLYSAARIGSEHTDIKLDLDKPLDQQRRSFTFPVSDDGHLRQQRNFLQAEFDHDLRRLVQENFGPLGLLNDLPFRVSKLRYHLEFRAEHDGIYDYGPSEYRNADQFFDNTLVSCGFDATCGFRNQLSTGARRRLRKLGVHRERLFQAFFDVQAADIFIRFGRQILAWGETDAFRLLDNINPTDASFGGFLVSLDERRVPLDMLMASYYYGTLGPLSEIFVEGYVAIDDQVGYNPGVPQGSPWNLPNLGAPSTTLKTVRNHPARSIEDARGGGKIKFNGPIPAIGDGTFTFAHYYTYLDVPSVRTEVDWVTELPDGTRFASPKPLPESSQGAGFLALATQSAPRVQITGASSTFTIPAKIARTMGLGGEPVIRAELAYFRNEPRHSQSQLDPFVYAFRGLENTGGRRTGDSWNAALGVDMNQFIRFLNSRQSFFFSTQFFYKHLNGAVRRRPFLEPGCTEPVPGCVVVTDGEVLPVPEFNQSPPGSGLSPIQSILIRNPVDQYLQTLLITTSYASGQINPSLTLFYDWSGAFVAVPAMTFSRDPFRFRIEYNYLEARRLKGASGVSMLRDRDNVLFQFEYVI